MPKALRVRDEIKSAYPDASIELVVQRGGFFDVLANDTIIFSKTKRIGTHMERFPEPGEILTLLEKAGFSN